MSTASKWSVHELSELAKFHSGGTPSKTRIEFWGGEVPWITASDLKTLHQKKFFQTLTRQGAGTVRVMPARAIYVLVRGMTLFKDLPIAFVDQPAAFNQDIKALIAVPGIDPEFLAYALVAHKDAIRQLVDQAGHGTGRLDTELLKSFPVPVPPLSEQRKIAEILRTWDDAIESNGRLVAARKSAFLRFRSDLVGTMAGPEHGFDSKPLRTISVRVNRKNDHASHPVMTISAKSGFVLQSDKYNRDMAGSSVSNYTLLRRGEFAYNKGNSLTYPQGCVFSLTQESALVPNVYISFRLNEELNQTYLEHVFASGYLNSQLSRLINSGVRNDGLLNLSVDDFFGCEIPVPPAPEQELIARALDEGWREVELLTDRGIKLRAQKRALMQKLLTGQIRVNVDEESDARH